MADWIAPAYFRYWSKARKSGEEGAPYHLFPYHCLDVAAVTNQRMMGKKGNG